MARKKSKNVKLSVRVPAGVKVSNSVLAEATRAAQAIVSAHNHFAVISQELAAKGINISSEELARRTSAGKPAKAAPAAKAGRPAAPKAKSTGKRRRTVLSSAQRLEVIASLKSGATISATAKKFKCSPQTVMIIKKGAGLVKSKVASKKKAAKKAAKKTAAKRK
jgi:colicin import membrane protein